MKRQIFLLTGLILFFASCTKDPDQYPDEPQIYYQSTTPRTIDIKDTAAFIRIELKFTDGDGDIGLDPGNGEMAIFLKDSRDTSKELYTYPYPFPFIPQSARPTKGGLEGGITINLGRQYFNVVDSLNLALKRDTLSYNIYIMDRAGHKSNIITTDSIYIQL